jgi:threonine dehydrogenase-like Zn-dependent dehydrogenase
MKALIVTRSHQPELQDLAAPKPGPYEALVKILACGVCSTTDRELIKGTQPYNKDYPCVLGHEAVGEVVEVGAKVRSYKRGDWVTRPVAIWPGERRGELASAWGGFAEMGFVRDARAMAADGNPALLHDYTALRQNVVRRDDLDLGEAVLAISLGETSSWFQHLPSVAGKRVCVAGTGIAGLSTVLWAKLAGAKQVLVLGRRKERLDLAVDLGADGGLNVKDGDPVPALKQLAGGGVEFFFEAVGQKEMLRTAVGVLTRGGVFARYAVAPEGGYEMPARWVPGDFSIQTPDADEHLTYAWACDLLRKGFLPWRKLLTHRWPLAEFQTALQEIGAGKVVKGMLTMGRTA